jgi:hypothetical protein
MHKQAPYMSKGFSNLSLIYGFGRNLSFVTQGTHLVVFLAFSKSKAFKI